MYTCMYTYIRTLNNAATFDHGNDRVGDSQPVDPASSLVSKRPTARAAKSVSIFSYAIMTSTEVGMI